MERDFIDWLAANLPRDDRVRLGVSDDAAVLAWAGGADMVVTTDTVTDQVDFHLAEVDPQLAGRKALAVNLSDLAAMAAEPVAAVISIVLPRDGAAGRTALELAIELYRGLIPLAEEFDLAIAGGDTNAWDGPLAISVTAIGRATARGPLTRSGAKRGDHVLVTGQLGGSILGRHLAFQPRVREALLLNERYELHAGMDISDGVALDASRLATASGCGLALQLDALPLSPDATKRSAQTGRTAVEHALGDGEDFELLFAAAPAVAEQIVRDQPLGVSVTHVGRCIEQPGLWQLDNAGNLSPLAATGFQH